MAYHPNLLKPWTVVDALRDQLGSVRKIYLGRDKVQRQDDLGDGEVVLLIHGFFQTRNLWEVMERRLRADGFAVISFQLSGLFTRFNTQPVRHSAELIAEKIERLAEKHSFSTFHIVGHSKGGLIARYYAQHLEGHRRVRSITTLGTPHHGTPTAMLGLALMGFGAIKSSAGDLLPGSKLIHRMHRIKLPDHVKITSIYSKEDLVCPWWCSVLEEGEYQRNARNVEFRGLGHSQLAWEPAVYSAVRDALDAASE